MAATEERLDAAEFRELLDATLRATDADAKLGPLLRATSLRMRLRFPDVKLVLNIAASDEPDHHVQWKFSDRVDWKPKLELTMDSQTANAFLQGKESLAVAIARGRVRVKGDARMALLYLPATRLMVEPYRRTVQDTHPDLVVA
jgi:putative sterol carrier protein